jgi:hypothetical protein
VLVTPVPSNTIDGNAAEKVREYTILNEITQAQKNNADTDGNLLVYKKTNEDINLELKRREAPVIPTAYAVNGILPTKGIAAQRSCYRCCFPTCC